MFAIYIFGLLLIAIVVFLTIHRIWRLHRDHILNPDDDPYLEFAEQEHRKRKLLFSPWTTTDPELLSIVKNNFPDIALPQIEKLTKPNLTPVKIEKFDVAKIKIDESLPHYFIAVGGPSAAMIAFEQAKHGNPVLYVNHVQTEKGARPIWAGAANLVEPDVLTEAPAYIADRAPLKFLWRECKRFLNPLRYDSDVLRDDYPWLSLNIVEWLLQPKSWLMGWRVARGNQQLARNYEINVDQHNVPEQFYELQKRTRLSGENLQTFNREHGKILRDPIGTLIVAPDNKMWDQLAIDEKLLQEAHALEIISQEQAKQKYGFSPRNAVGLMEKPHDFLLQPQFLQTITQAITQQDGEVQTNWRLQRILLAPEDKGGVMEFIDETNGGNKTHYRKFHHAHLSLGATLYQPNIYDLVSITGVSINALVFGCKLGGSIICGGVTNHIAISPIAEPVSIRNERTGKTEDVSLIRIAVGGCVGPVNRAAKKWYTYYGASAVNALHCLRKTLPADVTVKVLSVIGCNRVVGKDGRQVEIHPTIKVNGKTMTSKSVTIQLGAAGGGLTQMGYIPQIKL